MPSRVFAAVAAAALFGVVAGTFVFEADSATLATPATSQAVKVVPPPPPPKQSAAERCTSLEQQFTAEALLHLTSKKIASARKLADEGTDDCERKKYSLGTRRLVAALAELGVAAKL